VSRYADELSLRAGRQQYFERSGFDERSYTERWVPLKAGPLKFGFPNTASRIRAVRLHDLHHVLTEYETTWTGEAEIAGWEIASGCADHYAAWVLNFSALVIGLVIAPGRVFDAFVRGRHSRNLYGADFGEKLLERSVGDMRAELGLDRPRRATAADIVAFVWWSVVSILVGAAPLWLAMILLA
jgi:hypothetical protein